MRLPRLKPLSFVHQVAWYSASLVFGVCVFAFGIDAGAFSDEESRYAAILIFGISWLVGVLALRFYVQQIEDPTDFKSIIAAGRKRRY